MERTGLFTSYNAFSRCVSQLSDYLDVQFPRHYRYNRREFGLRYRHSSSHQEALSQGRSKGFISYKATGKAKPSHTGIFAADEASSAYQSAYTGVWFFNVVCGAFGGTFSKGNRDSFQQRPAHQTAASPRLFGTPSQTYTQGQTRRNRLQKGQENPCLPEKKAMKPDAKEALVFQDETEIHRHPILTRMWWTKGSQPRIPSPGENQKKVVYGGIDYATGRITCTIAETKSGYNFLAFLVTLVAAYAGRKIRLVCDNGRFHHTRAVRRWLKDHKDIIQVFWLPPYCPSLNLIERLWGHLKRTVIANVLFETMGDLVAAFRRGLNKVNGRRNKMGFIFDHDDVKTRAA
jgi:transposase